MFVKYRKEKENDLSQNSIIRIPTSPHTPQRFERCKELILGLDFLVPLDLLYLVVSVSRVPAHLLRSCSNLLFTGIVASFRPAYHYLAISFQVTGPI